VGGILPGDQVDKAAAGPQVRSAFGGPLLLRFHFVAAPGGTPCYILAGTRDVSRVGSGVPLWGKMQAWGISAGVGNDGLREGRERARVG
jgi:hypothetical protein